VDARPDLPTAGTATSDRRRLAIALALIVAFMAGEVVAGALARSLALLSDAAHMLTDAGAVALSLVALRLARRPPAGGLTYGLKRAEILSALANGTTLAVLTLLVVAVAIRRLVSPPAPDGWVMLTVACAGVVVNLLATWQLSGADRRSLGIRASFKHVQTDLYAFAGTAVAAAVILGTGFSRADPAASLLVAALMARASYGLVVGAARVLLEAAPEGMSIEEVRSAIYEDHGITDVHDLHVWEIASGFPALSAHVLVREGRDCHAVRRRIEERLKERFGIDHTTLQVDHDERGTPLVIGSRRGQGS
jgi:cobalt-zinc-cadmium efflux system protein